LALCALINGLSLNLQVTGSGSIRYQTKLLKKIRRDILLKQKLSAFNGV